MQILLKNLELLTKNFIKCVPASAITQRCQIVKYYCMVTANNVNALPETKLAESIEEPAEKIAQRSLSIAVIGVPNAGKSTFINNLINHRVCPTSSKVHTTRKANKAIYTVGQTQLVFYDTPGLVTQREIKKHNLERAFKSAYRHAVQNADVIAVLHDVSNTWTRNELHSTVVDTLKEYANMPSVLVLNKIDALKSKRVLLELIKTLTGNTLSGTRKPKSKSAIATVIESGSSDIEDDASFSDLKKREISWRHFSDVFLVSSITGDGLSQIHDFFINSAKPRNWQHSAEVFTDETPEVLIVESVRARLLDYLPQEIPYNLESAIEYYSLEKDTIYASVCVTCPTPRIERLICGESNGKLRQITERVISDLVETFGQRISLTIATKSRKEK